MMWRTTAVLASTAVLLIASSFATAADAPQGAAKPKAAPHAPQSKVPTLDDASKNALLKAIERQREGVRLYAAIIDKHGTIRPFAPILEAERRQEVELLNVAKRFALEVPASTATHATPPDTVKGACEAAAAWERSTAALFNQISADVKRPGIKNTLTRQASMATQRHLPAFERCVKLGGPLPAPAAAPGQKHRPAQKNPAAPQ